MKEIQYSDLDYGSYSFEDVLFTESIKYNTAMFSKLQMNRIKLPEGKGNVIYTLSNNWENSIKLVMDQKNCIKLGMYRYVHYTWYYIGSVLGKRFRINSMKLRNDRVNFMKGSKMIVNPSRSLVVGPLNVIYGVGDIYKEMKPLMEILPARMVATKFFDEFMRIVNNDVRPGAVVDEENPESNNRILMIDVDAFSFELPGTIQKYKTNPLFLLYLSIVRPLDPRQPKIDMDILLAKSNLFIKINPSKMNVTDISQFKTAMFRLMNVNLDNVTDNMPDEDKAQISRDRTDTIAHNVIDKKIQPYIQHASDRVKDVIKTSITQSVSDSKEKILNAVQKEKTPSENLSNVAPPDVVSNVEDMSDDPVVKQSVSEDNPNPNDNVFKRVMNDDVTTYKPLIDPEEELNVVNDLSIDDDEDGDLEQSIDNEVTGALTADEEIMTNVVDEIQDIVAPLKNVQTAPLNSVRDQKLREEQKKIVVKNSTIEEILAKDASNVKVKRENKSTMMRTANKNMHDIRFANFDKTYINEVMTKDIVGSFDMLKDKNTKFYISNIEVADSSTNMDYKETWTVNLVDQNKKKSTIKVDIPKFYNDRFLYLGGNKYIIGKQDLYMPLVKDTPDTVMLTTNYNKVMISRKATKSLSLVEKVFALVRKTGNDEMFTSGNSSKGNMKYISSLEYDELARGLFKFKTKTCELYFSREYIRANLEDKIPGDLKGNEFFIGIENGKPIVINEDTNRDRMNRTIIEIIYQNLPEDYQKIYNSTKAPKQSMHAICVMAGQTIPVGIICVIWVGLKQTLAEMKIQWNFIGKGKRIQESNNKSYIKFADGVLEYDKSNFSELVLNGLSVLKPEKHNFSDFENEECYSAYILSIWGNYRGIQEIRTFNEFLIDHITRDICKDVMLPDTAIGLLLHAIKLLCDNSHVSKACDNSYRTRCVETVPSILYSCIAEQYKAHVNSGGTIPMTLARDTIITKLLALPTVEAYSTLNPPTEVGRIHAISTRGYKGSNSSYAYTLEKRSYDPTSIGKLGMSTAADANVGITKQMVIEPTISNVRGYREQVEDIDSLKDVNIFSPVEMITPGTARVEDPMRTAIATKQTQHVIPVEKASPALVSNGYDEAIQYHLSNDFVINAEEDGEVVEVDEKVGFIIVKYKSGKCQAINMKPDIVKNSSSGFYLANQLTSTKSKVGEKVKKDEALAYHSKYFTMSEFSGLRHNVGPLVKMGFMSTYNTYEDAGICTRKMSEMMQSKIVYMEDTTFKRNANILFIAKIGDHLNIGDPLIKFDTSYDDSEIAKYINKLSEENQAIINEETKNDITSNHAGTIIDIKVYTLLDPSNLSKSLGKIVNDYFDKGKSKMKLLGKHDKTPGIVKAGYMLTDSTEPVVHKYNAIKGRKGIDVLIEFYIEHSNLMGVGDKIALYSANKQIVSEVIADGFEPFSEFRPDEEVSVLTSPGTIARRMTPAVLSVAAAGKVLVELKRKIKNEIKYK